MSRMTRIWPGLFMGVLLLVPAGVIAQQEVVYTPEELSEMPTIKSGSQAQRAIQRAFQSFHDAGKSGRIQLRFVVSAEGVVDRETVAVVAATDESAGEAAINAICNVEFKPGKKDGEAVATMVLMPISFGD